jgi:hypothetical protein
VSKSDESERLRRNGSTGLFHIVGATFVAADDADGPLFFIRFAGLIAFALFVAASSVSLISATSTAGRLGHAGE